MLLCGEKNNIEATPKPTISKPFPNPSHTRPVPKLNPTQESMKVAKRANILDL